MRVAVRRSEGTTCGNDVGWIYSINGVYVRKYFVGSLLQCKDMRPSIYCVAIPSLSCRDVSVGYFEQS